MKKLFLLFLLQLLFLINVHSYNGEIITNNAGDIINVDNSNIIQYQGRYPKEGIYEVNKDGTNDQNISGGCKFYNGGKIYNFCAVDLDGCAWSSCRFYFKDSNNNRISDTRTKQAIINDILKITNDYIFYEDGGKIWRVNVKQPYTGDIAISNGGVIGAHFIHMDDNYLYYFNNPGTGNTHIGKVKYNINNVSEIEHLTSITGYYINTSKLNIIGNKLFFSDSNNIYSFDFLNYSINTIYTNNTDNGYIEIIKNNNIDNYLYFLYLGDSSQIFFKLNISDNNISLLKTFYVNRYYIGGYSIMGDYLYYYITFDGFYYLNINSSVSGKINNNYNIDYLISDINDNTVIYYTTSAYGSNLYYTKIGGMTFNINNDYVSQNLYQDNNYLYYINGNNRSLYKVLKSSLNKPNGDSNGNYSHYILNRLTATEGNMQYVNNSAGSTSFSNSSQVKANFLANYPYMQTWYEAKGLTLDVVNNNVDWDNGVTFSKSDVAGGMLAGYKLSAHYPFMSYKETDNHDSSIFWRTDLINTSFQTDTTWNNVGLPAYPIRNGSGGIVAYLEFPCGNLICKDQYCSEVKKIVNPTILNPIAETVFSDPGNGLPFCGDNIKNTMDEECDGNDGIKHDQGESCNAQCKVVIGGNTPGCPSYSGLGYICSGATPTPIFTPSSPTPPGGGGGGGNTGTTNTGAIINWTPPGSITLPNIGDINTNTGMTDTEKTIAKDIVCSAVDEGFKVSKSIIVTNTMADTSLISRLKGKDEFLKTLSGSSSDVAEKIIGKKIKSSQLNQKSNLYDFGSGGTISGIQFNLSEMPNSAVMRKLVDLAIDHSSTTMADYEQTVKDSCNNSSIVTGKEVVPAGFIDVNEKGQTILNLFRFNGN